MAYQILNSVTITVFREYADTVLALIIGIPVDGTSALYDAVLYVDIIAYVYIIEYY